MKKKLVSLCLVVALFAVTIVGTLAYFTDSATAKNTFTVGEDGVEIKLDEADVVFETEAGATTDQGSYKAQTTRNETGVAYENLYPGAKLPKDPTITNTGDYDAYVKAEIIVDLDLLKGIGAINAQNEANYDVFKEIVTGGVMDPKAGTAEGIYSSQNDKITGISGLGNEDYQFAEPVIGTKTVTFTVYKLAPLTVNSKLVLFESINLPETLTLDDMKKLDDGAIEIKAYAIQAKGFDGADAAFTALNAEDFTD